MILPGRVAQARGILTNLHCSKTQVQPCGIDLSVKHVLSLESSGSIDFDNTRRKIPTSSILQFGLEDVQNTDENPQFLCLTKGSYLVEFNELVRMPRDIMGQLFVRSSLFRSGAELHAGVMDSGYEGVIGAMLIIHNKRGLRLYQNARLAQMVFHELTEPTDAYSGRYQGSEKL